VGPERDPPRPSAIAFDLYGTLLDVASLVEVCRADVGDEIAAPFVDLWRRKQLEYTWLRALMDRYEDFWRVTAEALDQAAARLGCELDDAARARLMDGWLELKPYPEVRAALETIAHGSIPMAVVSNGSPTMLREVLAGARLGDRFAAVLSVDAVRTYKPAAAVYAMAEREIGHPRRSVLFVSANGWDVAGAKTFGFRVAWVNRASVPPEGLGADADAVVQDVTEIARIAAGAPTERHAPGEKTSSKG
jgi:2-haloacid dehalogenase